MNDQLNRHDPLDPHDLLDHAVRSALADIVATTPERADSPLDSMPVSRLGEYRSRRVPVMAGSLALAAAASLALVVVVTRNHDTQGSSDAPAVTTAPGDTISNSTTASMTTAPTDATTPAGTQPVQFAPGVVPWYEASDLANLLGVVSYEPGPAQDSVRCTDWTYVDVVTCRALTTEGYLPAVTYSAAGGNYVDIATLHADIDAATYANNYSHGRDVGYDAPLLPLEDVTVNGRPGKLVEVANGIRRVTWSPTPGTLVAVETNSGSNREDILTIAAGVVPTTQQPTVLLVLATTPPDADGLSVEALGSIVDVELCIPTNQGCTSAAAGTLVIEHSFSSKEGIVGLAGAGIVSLRITLADGITVVMFPDGAGGDPLTDLVVGTSRAFAIDLNGRYDIKIVGLDASGTPIAGTEAQIAGMSPTTMVIPTSVG